MTDRIRRAARSGGANISEAWGKRRDGAHFVSKLTDAAGGNHEVEHWLITAKRDGYLTETKFTTLLGLKREAGRMLGLMIRDPESFLLN